MATARTATPAMAGRRRFFCAVGRSFSKFLFSILIFFLVNIRHRPIELRPCRNRNHRRVPTFNLNSFRRFYFFKKTSSLLASAAFGVVTHSVRGSWPQSWGIPINNFDLSSDRENVGGVVTQSSGIPMNGRFLGRDPPSSGVVTPKLGNPHEQLWSFIGSRECWGVVTPKLGSWPKVGELLWVTLIFRRIARIFWGVVTPELGSWPHVRESHEFHWIERMGRFLFLPSIWTGFHWMQMDWMQFYFEF